jgi:hypothetical protein
MKALLNKKTNLSGPLLAMGVNVIWGENEHLSSLLLFLQQCLFYFIILRYWGLNSGPLACS